MGLSFRSETIKAVLLDPRAGFSPVEHEMEFRYDPLTGRSTRLAHYGAIKPQPLNLDDYDGDKKGFCPFCSPNMENVTSLFPADLVPEGRLRIGEATLLANIAPYDAYSGLVVLSDKHVLSLRDMTPERLSDAFTLALEFLRRVGARNTEIPYYFMGWNYMPPSGGGLVHAHIQVFGSKDPGNVFADSLQAAKRYKKENGRPYWPDYIAEEQKRAVRYLGSTGPLHWLVPFAPLGVLGDVLAVLPGSHAPSDVSPEILSALVSGIRRLFDYYESKRIFSFNASVHFSPDGSDSIPLMVRFSPRTFLNTKFYPPDTNFFHVMLQQPICVVRPEELAADIHPFFR